VHEGDHIEGRDFDDVKFLRFSYTIFSIKTRMTPNGETIDEGGPVWLQSVLA
jgi:hypothetical protein